jgi:hypothetical protein
MAVRRLVPGGRSLVSRPFSLRIGSCGVELGFARQLIVVGICVLDGIETIILGVDRFLDMCRTT